MRRVLVVDDEPDIVESLAEGLQTISGQPVRIHRASSGEEARAILQGDPQVDVILSDARMPGLSGLDLLGWARMSGHQATRVLLTGQDVRLFQYQLEHAAPAAVVTKPIDLAGLARLTGLSTNMAGGAPARPASGSGTGAGPAALALAGAHGAPQGSLPTPARGPAQAAKAP